LRRLLLVKVRKKTAEGSYKPLHGATVMIGDSAIAGGTEADGNVKLFHSVAPGEEARVSVSMPGYRPAVQNVQINARGTLGSYDRNSPRIVTGVDTVLVVLKKGDTGQLTGQVSPDKGRVKLEEQLNVAVGISYEGEAQTRTRRSRDDRTSRQGDPIQPGRRNRQQDRLPASPLPNPLSGAGRLYRACPRFQEGLQYWTGRAAPVHATTQRAAPTVTGGYFRLVKQDVCTAHAPGGGTVKESYSVSPTTSPVTLKAGSTHGTLTATYGVPDAVLKPNTTISLSGDAAANLDKGMQGYSVGIGCDWGASGSGTMEGQGAYAGMASDGKYIQSAHCEKKLHIGTGGKIAIWTRGGSPTAEGRAACTYLYEWVSGSAPLVKTPGERRRLLRLAAADSKEDWSGAGTFKTSVSRSSRRIITRSHLA